MPSTERTAGYLAQTNASQPSAIETIPTSTARQHLNLATKVRWLAFMLYCVGRTRNKEKMPKNDLDFFHIHCTTVYTDCRPRRRRRRLGAMRRNKTTAFWCWPHANGFSVTGPLSRWYHAIQSHVKAN